MTTITQTPDAGYEFHPVPGAQEPIGTKSAAAGGWFDCIVNLTGQAEDGTVFIHLRERAGQFDRWYSATQSMKKEMLATALVALSSNKPVSANLNTTDEYGVINRLYVRSA